MPLKGVGILFILAGTLLNMLKPKSKVIGIDDSPFKRGDRHSLIVSVLLSHDFHIESIHSAKIEVDGNDAEDTIVEIASSPHGMPASLIMTQGITFAGFNIIDPVRLSKRTGKPVISVTRREPDISSMVEALRKHSGSQEKVRMVLDSAPVRFDLGNGTTIYGNYSGITKKEAELIIGRFTQRGKIPEPVRLAHLIGEVIFSGRTGTRV